MKSFIKLSAAWLCGLTLVYVLGGYAVLLILSIAWIFGNAPAGTRSDRKPQEDLMTICIPYQCDGFYNAQPDNAAKHRYVTSTIAATQYEQFMQFEDTR